MWQRYFPAFEAEIPYNVAYVELEEGPRLMTNLVGVANNAIYCDMPVEVVFEDVTPEISLPKVPAGVDGAFAASPSVAVARASSRAWASTSARAVA